MWSTVFLCLIVTTSRAASAIFLPTDIPTFLLDNVNDTYNITDVANIINGILKSLNLSDVEVNIILNRLEDSQQLANTRNNIELKEFEKSVTLLFKTTIGTNWQIKHALQEIATAANNVTVYEILFETLWQELRSDNNKSNPFLYIELYKDVESVLTNITSEKLDSLGIEIQMSIVRCSAQLLQSYFIQNSTIWQLLAQLKQFDHLYRATIPKVFENLNSIEDQWMIAKELLDFDLQTQEAVFNHISYIKYLQTRTEVIPYGLYNNLQMLIARPDFINISVTQRQMSAKLLPVSMGNLFAAQQICIRNHTTNVYFYECPQTYLMCTTFITNNVNPINRKKAAFEIERIGNDQYTLRSPYWARYLHLQMSNSKNSSSPVRSNNITTILNITKNLYSHAEASSWFIRFQGDYATIQDSTEEFYVCGGNPLYWNNMEKYAYTRQSISSSDIRQECLWLLEDCSDIA